LWAALSLQLLVTMPVRSLILLVVLALLASASPGLAQRQRPVRSAVAKPSPRARFAQTPVLRRNKVAPPKAPARVAKGKGRRATTGTVVIDVGGEGAHRGAINLNPNLTTSTTGAPGRPIPNLVLGVGERLPFASHSADTLIVESAPVRAGSAQELARVIRPGGTIRLVHPSDYARAAHQSVIDAVVGTVMQSTEGGMTTTVIVATPR